MQKVPIGPSSWLRRYLFLKNLQTPQPRFDAPDMSNTKSPSIFLLQAAQGGVVNNAHVAMRLAELILRSAIGRHQLSANWPLKVEDRGDRWVITGTAAQSNVPLPDLCCIAICKRDAAVLLLNTEHIIWDILDSASTVQKFAEILLENTYGKAELHRQLLFVVEDQIQTWVVNGSGNADRQVDGPGPYHIEVRKRDGRVIDIWLAYTLKQQ